ncbi:MAG TPA: hypothetical protein PKG82_11570, partial [Myxococcota bacterium]|nr:hypothetical protein [Myxococcota bacterium]
CGCWLFSGSWTEKGNMMARRDNSDPSGLGNTPNWAFSWPANRRMYVLHSASHGAWAATAGHGAPGAPDPRYDFGDDGSGFKPSIPPAPWPTISKSVNNFDVFAYWPLADDLIDRVVRNRKVSRKDSGKKLFMGKWPDGKPFPRASIAPDPCLPEIESN